MHAHGRPAIHSLTGEHARRHLHDVAALRIRVFRDWPYLYAGDAGYERDYLAAYAASPHSVFVLACDGERVIGASTGLPLADDAPAFRAPFEARGIDPAKVFYLGESVLQPDWRGRGVGRDLVVHRMARARMLRGIGLM